MKRWLPVVLLLAGLAVMTTAPAVSAQEGIKLAWDQCLGSGNGNLDKSFACDVNSGAPSPFIFVASFTAPDSISLFTACQASVALISAQDPLPDWWKLRNQTGQLGQCRNGAMTTSADFLSGYTGCTDPYQGAASGGFSFYTLGRLGTATAEMKVTFALPTANQIPLNPGEEYFAFRASLTAAKSVGTGSCAGCSVPVCLVLNWVTPQQPTGTPGSNVTIPDPIGPATRSITWQGGTAADCNVVPTRNHTWGQIKALYR